MSRCILRPSVDCGGARPGRSVARAALQLTARALAQVAEAREAEPAGEAHDGRGADAGALRERFGGVEGELVEVLA